MAQHQESDSDVTLGKIMSNSLKLIELWLGEATVRSGSLFQYVNFIAYRSNYTKVQWK